MDGLEKDLAQMNALATTSAEHLQKIQDDIDARPSAAQLAQEKEHTLAGLAIGGLWDLAAGKAATSEARVERAQKADGYAEIAADTFASIPKFEAITGGIARSVLLLDVSGQSSAGQIAKGVAFNFLQGAALNSVSRMASSESTVGRLVSGRLGAGVSAEIVTHAISGGGFGLVKSGLSEKSWLDTDGHFSLGSGLENITRGVSVGTLIGIPAGMAGLRVGRAVTLGLGGSVEQSALAGTMQKFAVGAGSGFASGSVFGGVDAAKSGKSWSQILDSSWQGGAVGALTGGFASGFDRGGLQNVSAREGQIKFRGSLQNRLQLAPDFEISGTAASDAAAQTTAREHGDVSLTDQMLARSAELLKAESLAEAHDRLSYKPQKYIRVEDFAGRLKEPVVEDRAVSRLKQDAPKTKAEYEAYLKTVKTDKEPLEFSKHFYEPFVEKVQVPMRVYAVEGHTTKIVVPEDYAQKLDVVRALRKINDQPSAWDRLTQQQRFEVSEIMKGQDATKLAPYMSREEISQYVKTYQAGQQLRAHPLQGRALPEDLIPILDALPNRHLIKTINLHDARNYDDLFKATKYRAPEFAAAATVGESGVVDLYQSNYGSALYNTVFHEWSHVAKWRSPVYSRMFDLATVADHQHRNIDHQATADVRKLDPTHKPIIGKGLYYGGLHATRDQDENFAAGLGEEIMGSDPDKLFVYANRAPVRGMILANALKANIRAAGSANESSLAPVMMDRAQFVSDSARPYALGTLQDKIQNGSTEEKAAAIQLMADMATKEQADILFQAMMDKSNRVVPNWEGTAAREVMGDDQRNVAQHAFDAYLQLMHDSDKDRFSGAMALMLQKPEIRDLAANYAERSEDARAKLYAPLIKIYDPNGDLNQRAVGVHLAKEFGGEDKADLLLAIALHKGSDRVPNFRDTDMPPQFVAKMRTLGQTAYKAYIEAAAEKPQDRYQLAFENGLNKGSHRDLAARYLENSWDERAKGLGQYLQMRQMPGHLSKMQELINENFLHDAPSQKMVFDQMMRLSKGDNDRQIEIIGRNLHVPSLMGESLNQLDGLLGRETTSLQRRNIQRVLAERMEWDNFPDKYRTRMEQLSARAQHDDLVQEAIVKMNQVPGARIAAMHELTMLHDARAIKPLLQQAVSGNEIVQQEAIGALREFNPSLVKFYAQELKREYDGNPIMVSKISDLLSSHVVTPVAVLHNQSGAGF